MVVDDEATIRETIAIALEAEGYSVLTATDGRTALEQLTHSKSVGYPFPAVDLIILDVLLPGCNGLDLCRWLRSQDYLLPILILSAKGSESDRVVGLEVGADDYLAKPFGLQELVARCRALLRRSHHSWVKEKTLRWKDITLYTEACQVIVRGQKIALSPKEYCLLELFMRHPRRAWEREQLLERIWGEDYVGDTKTIDVHIRWLREKLEKNPSQLEYLQTVRGLGYRFGA